MSNDMKVLKYETLIEDINEVIDSTPVKRNLCRKIVEIFGEIEDTVNSSLAMVFDYDKLNDYGKVIFERSRLYVYSRTNEITEVWSEQYPDISAFKDHKYKIEAAKGFIKYCKNDQNRQEAYKFVFWAMMVLTVDKTDAAKHLSLICDFARMLKISDDEMNDILMVIKAIYQEEVGRLRFKSEDVFKIFSEVLCDFEIVIESIEF